VPVGGRKEAAKSRVAKHEGAGGEEIPTICPLRE